MTRPGRYPQELRERAIRFEHQDEHSSQWAAITSIAEKFGVSSETLRKWVRRAETNGGLRPGLTTDERERLKSLERENRELRRANEILKSAAASSGRSRPKRWNRCLPYASASSSRCPSIVAASAAKRRCGDDTAISWPASSARCRRAMRWMRWPSGMPDGYPLRSTVTGSADTVRGREPACRRSFPIRISVRPHACSIHGGSATNGARRWWFSGCAASKPTAGSTIPSSGCGEATSPP